MNKFKGKGHFGGGIESVDCNESCVLSFTLVLWCQFFKKSSLSEIGC